MISANFLHFWFLILSIGGLFPCINCQLRASNTVFSYNDSITWGSQYPQCSGLRQSPVALRNIRSIPLWTNPINFHNYNVPLSKFPIAKNNGKSVEVVIGKTVNGESPYITLDGIDNIYELNSVHFHWGSAYKKGSEHTIEGIKYDLEMHLVHKSSTYSTVEDASIDPEGLVVFAILFEQVMNGGPLKPTGVNQIFETLPYLTAFNSERAIKKPFTAQSLLDGVDTSKFFTYRGSLTTPPCSQAVIWFVFTDILPVRRQVLKQFWALRDDQGNPLINNNRPLQPLLLRKVWRHR